MRRKQETGVDYGIDGPGWVAGFTVTTLALLLAACKMMLDGKRKWALRSLLAAVGEGDLVVMTTHGPSRPGATTRESVAMRTLVSISQPMLIQQASSADPVVVDGYQACSWAEPLHRNAGRMS